RDRARGALSGEACPVAQLAQLAGSASDTPNAGGGECAGQGQAVLVYLALGKLSTKRALAPRGLNRSVVENGRCLSGDSLLQRRDEGVRRERSRRRVTCAPPTPSG